MTNWARAKRARPNADSQCSRAAWRRTVNLVLPSPVGATVTSVVSKEATAYPRRHTRHSTIVHCEREGRVDEQSAHHIVRAQAFQDAHPTIGKQHLVGQAHDGDVRAVRAKGWAKAPRQRGAHLTCRRQRQPPGTAPGRQRYHMNRAFVTILANAAGRVAGTDGIDSGIDINPCTVMQLRCPDVIPRL